MEENPSGSWSSVSLIDLSNQGEERGKSMRLNQCYLFDLSSTCKNTRTYSFSFQDTLNVEVGGSFVACDKRVSIRLAPQLAALPHNYQHEVEMHQDNSTHKAQSRQCSRPSSADKMHRMTWTHRRSGRCVLSGQRSVSHTTTGGGRP